MAQTEPRWRFTTKVLVGLLIIAALTGAAAGYLAGRTLPPAGAVAHIGIALGPTENAISVEADGWTYGVPLDVAWIDGSGSHHGSGRPECLPPNGEYVEIRFYSVDASDLGWRPVVLVDCQHAKVLPLPTD